MFRHAGPDVRTAATRARATVVTGDDSWATTDPAVHLFVYGTLRAGGGGDGAGERLLGDCRPIGRADVHGVLYDIDGAYPALVLAGTGRVLGEIWRCPASALPRLDRYEGVEDGLFRRVALRIGEVPCWTYVAGPALAHRLMPDRRIECGVWRGGETDGRA